MNVLGPLPAPLPRPCRSRLSAPSQGEGETFYDRFLERALQEGSTTDHLAYLDRGIDQSPLKSQIPCFPLRLQVYRPTQKAGQVYPLSGHLPRLEEGLDYLHPSITEACVCYGGWQDGQLTSRWEGRNATSPVQMWSATKTFPMLRVTVQAARSSPDSRLEDCQISPELPLTQAFDDIVSYRRGGSASNQHARTLKHFDTPQGLEDWLKSLTGHTQLTFQGGYGEPASHPQPELRDTRLGRVVLPPAGAEHKGQNLVCAYDLCRVIGNLAWHPHLPQESRISGLSGHGFETLSRALATDSARYVEVALEELGVKERVRDLVVLSKLGFGLSDQRQRWEAVYSAFVSFRDGQSGEVRQMALALRGHRAPEGDFSAVELDARMAASVAQILARQL